MLNKKNEKEKSEIKKMIQIVLLFIEKKKIKKLFILFWK